jgi:PPOX class probable F420-dependent enzyme
MKLIDAAEVTQSLFDAPSPATITLYDANGEAVVSPVWFRLHGDTFQVVMAIADRKLAHLRRDPRCVLLIFETVPPFRGVKVRGRATLTPDEGAEARFAIASRYLGSELGRRYADVERRPPGVVVGLPIADAQTWDLSLRLP